MEKVQFLETLKKDLLARLGITIVGRSLQLVDRPGNQRGWLEDL